MAVSFPPIPHVAACSRVDQSVFLELLCSLWSLKKVLESGECLIHPDTTLGQPILAYLCQEE